MELAIVAGEIETNAVGWEEGAPRNGKEMEACHPRKTRSEARQSPRVFLRPET
jgi:hypothetical protein